jgi:HSP20 family protein
MAYRRDGMNETQAPEKTRNQQSEGREQSQGQVTAREGKQKGEAEGRVARRDRSQDDSRSMTPRVDVLEDETGITLFADMPGVAKDALEIKVEGDSLLIEGEVSAATPESMEAAYAEVRIPRYRRSFTLSRELDTAKIEASLKDGVLKLRIPKQEQAQPRRISIKAG